MAKKQKVELTPEEKAAKKLRNSNGWVRFWAIVVALALTAGIYGLASKTASKETAATGTATASGSSTGSSSSSSGSSSGSSSSSSSGASASSSSGASASAGDSSGAAAAASSGVDAAAAAEAINAATAKAVAAGYHWTRSAQYTQPVDVGSATSGLNTLIKGIDPEASLDSVVGGFIGIGDKEMDIEKGGSAAEQIDYHGENYALQASDLKNLKVDGNTYTFEVENATSPQTDKSTAMSRLTNDILTQSMVDSEIKNFISAAKINSAVIEYTNIKATVVIEDGNLKEFKYSYDGNVAELNIKVAFISVNGKGAMHVDGAYTNFVY